MKIKKSYSFYCKDLNQEKYQLLYSKAIKLRDFRNKISKEVCRDINSFIGMSKFDWIKYFRCKIKGCNNQDISNSIEEVYTSYDNKFMKFKNSIQFKVQDKIEKTFYKRNTKTHKKGDIRTFDIKMKSTKITKVLSYLGRYYSIDMEKWLLENKDKDEKKKSLRNDAYNLLCKYSDRIKKLINSRRNRVITEITKYPITFSSFTYKSCNELKMDLLNRNKNEKSIYGCYITIGAQNTEDGKLHIPVKFSEDHHGKIDEYSKNINGKGQKVISYRICFSNKKRVRVILTKDSKYEEVINKNNYLGVDVNVKHNIFSTSQGDFIDYDRRLFNDYVKFLKKLDIKHENKLKYRQDTSLSNKDNIKKDKWKIRIQDMLKRKSNELIKYAKMAKKDHLVLEDLELMGKSFSRNSEFEGFKYSRLIRLLNLADLKNILHSIGNKNEVQVTFVQPHYTSQTCTCGNITKSNRKTQEMFSCVDCGRELNADINSALNIESRMSCDFLRDKLLSCTDGIFKPKKLRKNTIKNILYDYYTSSDKAIVK